ncbi:TPA: DUF1120 domain-containing protein [Pseudomonas aeruginosa]|nr:DUF1120 domain-containing protein [Pseudomonas aeruginosa]
MKLKRMTLGMLCVSLLAANPPVGAAELSVGGQVRPGGACGLALGNGGVFELGTISRKDLKEAEETYIGPPGGLEISLGILCQAPTKVALRMLDNRAGTSISSVAWAFGLGASGGRNVGWYSVWIDRINGDGKPGLPEMRQPPGQAWEHPQQGWGWATRPSWLYSWAEKGQTSPQGFQDIRAVLELFPMIAPAKDLDLSQEIAIDGSATLELVYL